MFRAAWLLPVALTLSACISRSVIPLDVGGSQSDGTIVMVATTPVHDWVDSDSEEENARHRCIACGFASVEPFGGFRSRCAQHGLFGSCSMYELERMVLLESLQNLRMLAFEF